MHPERQTRSEALNAHASRGDWELLYQKLMLHEFPYEARMGWQLAFLRPFAVPRMARLLVEAGQLVKQPRKRAYDTGLIIYEIVYGGLDSPRAREMVSLINRSHHGRSIASDEFTYVLCAFIVTPIRHIDWVGWRSITDTEKEAAVRFFGRLGELMNIEHIPESYAAAEAFYDDFERKNVEWSREGALLGRTSIDILKSMQPRITRPLAALTFTILLDDSRVARAVGLRPPPTLVRLGAHLLARAAGFIEQNRPPRTRMIFTPGKVVRGVYPHGYRLEDLGPEVVRAESSKVDGEASDRST